MKKKKNIQSRWAIAIVAAIILLTLFLLFRPVMHAPTNEANLGKTFQGSKAQQTQNLKIEITEP